MNRVLVFWLALLSVFVGGTILVVAWRSVQEDPITVEKVDEEYLELPADSDQKWLQEFTLIRRTNEPFHSEQLKGQVWIASFFFASCPTVCRKQNEYGKLLHSDFSDEGVTFVGITCDPESDSPEILQSYAKQFTNDDQRWFFLTGNLDYIRRIAGEKFQFPLAAKTHSERFALVDKWGNYRGAYHWDKPEEWLEMRREIKNLVAEEIEPKEYVEKKQEMQESLRKLEDAQQSPAETEDLSPAAPATP